MPAPRTDLAEVTLTVPRRHDKAYLGLYTLVEPADRAFPKHRFHTDPGLLLKPQGLRGLEYLGDDWEKYRGQYRPLAEPGPDEAKRLIEFVRLVQQGGDRGFHNHKGFSLLLAGGGPRRGSPMARPTSSATRPSRTRCTCTTCTPRSSTCSDSITRA